MGKTQSSLCRLLYRVLEDFCQNSTENGEGFGAEVRIRTVRVLESGNIICFKVLIFWSPTNDRVELGLLNKDDVKAVCGSYNMTVPYLSDDHKDLVRSIIGSEIQISNTRRALFLDYSDREPISKRSIKQLISQEKSVIDLNRTVFSGKPYVENQMNRLKRVAFEEYVQEVPEESCYHWYISITHREMTFQYTLSEDERQHYGTTFFTRRHLGIHNVVWLTMFILAIGSACLIFAVCHVRRQRQMTQKMVPNYMVNLPLLYVPTTGSHQSLISIGQHQEHMPVIRAPYAEQYPMSDIETRQDPFSYHDPSNNLRFLQKEQQNYESEKLENIPIRLREKLLEKTEKSGSGSEESQVRATPPPPERLPPKPPAAGE
uniref:Uncharacterized protein n=1 Tax=Syphacia muris TaxID=451379 RepID=A0A0N5AJN8_9BILA